MTPNAWLSVLLRTSLEGGALLLMIWAVARLWPRMPAAARCGLWWLGALRMIVGLVPLPKIAVPWTFTPTPPSPASWPSTLPTPVVEIGTAVAGMVAAPTVATPSPVNLIPLAIAAVWIAGVVVGAVLMTRRLVAMRRSWRTAQLFTDERIARWKNEWAVVLGRNRVPEVRASAETRVPVAIGAFRPGLLLPADSTHLSDDALRVVLAHEMSHVRRGDPLLGWVPATAQLLFWFHPLVRFAVREYLAAREEVCDADALRATAVSPHDYGALLVDYGVGRMSEVPGAACCGSRGSRDLKRRLEMLSRKLAVPLGHRMGAVAVTFAVVALAFAPIRFVAAHEKDEGSSEYLRAKEKAEWKDAEARYPVGAEEMKKAESEMRLEELKMKRAGMLDKRTPDGPRKHSEFAYAIKTRGKKGTRGSIDMADMESLRRLDYDDETAVYFRIGEDQWVSKDLDVIDEVTRALEPEDRFGEGYRGDVERVRATEQERMAVEQRRRDLERRKEALEERRDKLRDELDRRREAGASIRDLRDEVGAIERELDELYQANREVSDAYQMLAEKRNKAYTFDKMRFAEMDKVHQRVLEDVREIAKRAIDEGRAERYEP